MALSHHGASEIFAEKDPGSAVLISDGIAVVVLGSGLMSLGFQLSLGLW